MIARHSISHSWMKYIDMLVTYGNVTIGFVPIESMIVDILTKPLAAAVKTATEVEVRAIQDHTVIEWNTCWKCRLSEGTDDI